MKDYERRLILEALELLNDENREKLMELAENFLAAQEREA